MHNGELKNLREIYTHNNGYIQLQVKEKTYSTNMLLCLSKQ